MQQRVVVQHHRQLMQLPIAKTFGFDRNHRGEHIFAVGAGLAVALPHIIVFARPRTRAEFFRTPIALPLRLPDDPRGAGE
jgi:hypothetical protein